VSAQIVANGIYEALITTVFGLIIAIVAMVAHSLLSNRVDRFTGEVETACTDIVIDLARYGNAQTSEAYDPSGFIE
jgi:biopolymer transport protein ExbB